MPLRQLPTDVTAVYDEPFRRRFAAKIQVPESGDGCHLWTGGKRCGYGILKHEGRMRSAHRVAWELAHGPIPPRLEILHGCDTPACCNVAHMRLGTHAENMADRDAKGRRPSPVYVGGPVRLTEEKVQAIRARRADGASPALLAEAYGVTLQTIDDVVLRRTWKHVA